MRLVQYIIANKGLGMSGGKLAAQCAHASCFGYQATRLETIKDWNESGHTKIVLEARDTEHLLLVERYLKEHGIWTHLVIDEGRTEIPSHTPTALATAVVDKDDPKVAFAFGDLKTYKDPKPVQRKGKFSKAIDYLTPV